MKNEAQYTQEDCDGIALFVGTIVGHSVDCAVTDGALIGSEAGLDVFQIMPTPDVERISPVKEFWRQSDYGKTQQFWASPVTAGMHYTKHYLLFIRDKPA